MQSAVTTVIMLFKAIPKLIVKSVCMEKNFGELVWGASVFLALGASSTF